MNFIMLSYDHSTFYRLLKVNSTSQLLCGFSNTIPHTHCFYLQQQKTTRIPSRWYHTYTSK